MPSSSSSVSSSIGNPEYSRGIWLRKLEQSLYNSNRIQGFRFKVVAYGGNEMPNFIFRYTREALNVSEGTYRLAFDGVCSPVDLEEYPESEPIVGVFPEFCRLDYVDLVFRSQSIAEDAWNIMVEEVGNLVYTLDIMEKTVPVQDLKLGNPPPAEFLSDSSSSA